MRGLWRLTRLAGVDINVHWSFSFIILWVILQGALTHGKLAGIVFALIAVLLLFGCVLLHELGHALVATYLHVPVKNIILLPLGGLVQMQSLPEKPLEDMLIAGSGPLVNLVIAVGLLPVVLFLAEPTFLSDFINSPGIVLAVMPSFFRQGVPIGLIVFLLLANLILFFFNLIPAFPMDGGQLLRAGLSLLLPYPQATRIAIRAGQFIALLLFLLALYFKSPGLIFVAIFVFAAGRPLRFRRVKRWELPDN